MTKYIVVTALLLGACGGQRTKDAEAPAAAEPAPVAVPPVAATADDALPPPRRATAPEPEREDTDDGTASVKIEVDQGKGSVSIRSAPDSGVKVWGTFNRTDGGFSFKGGFSTHADAGAP